MGEISNELRELLNELSDLNSALTGNAKIQRVLEARRIIVHNKVKKIRNNCSHAVIDQFGGGPIMGNLYSVCAACRQEFKNGVKIG